MDMDEKELIELQSPESWDDDEGEVRPPVKSPRAVVSVGFSRGDFQEVAEQARRQGMKTSEFIRQAALDRIRSRTPSLGVVSASDGFRTGSSPASAGKAKVQITTESRTVLVHS